MEIIKSNIMPTTAVGAKSQRAQISAETTKTVVNCYNAEVKLKKRKTRRPKQTDIYLANHGNVCADATQPHIDWMNELPNA